MAVNFHCTGSNIFGLPISIGERKERIGIAGTVGSLMSYSIESAEFVTIWNNVKRKNRNERNGFRNSSITASMLAFNAKQCDYRKGDRKLGYP